MAIGAKLTAASDYLFRRLFKFLFRYDIFISYARRDGKGYALKLRDQLTKLDFSCFLDYDELPAGNSLNRTLRRAIRRSAVVVLVGTEGALQSRYVELEVAEFTRTNRALIPIDFEGTLAAAPWGVIRERDLVWIDETKDALAKNAPSPQVADQIDKLFKYTRRNVRVRGQVIATAALFLLGAAASVLLIQQQVRAARTASAEARKQTDIANEASERAKVEQANAANAVRDARAAEARAVEAAAKAAKAEQLADTESKRATEQSQIADAKKLEAERAQAEATAAEERAKVAGQLAEERARATRVGLANLLSVQAGALLDQRPRQSLLMAVEATRATREDDPRVVASEEALRRTLARAGGRVLGGEGWHVNAGWNPFGAPEGLGPSETALSPDGRWMASATWNRVRLFDLKAEKAGAPARVIEEAGAPVAFTPDGRRLIAAVRVPRPKEPGPRAVTTGPQDFSVRVWDVNAAGAEPLMLGGHREEVRAIEVSPDGRWLVTGGESSAANLWDLRQSRPAARPLALGGPEDKLIGLAVSADGRWLVTSAAPRHSNFIAANRAGQLRLWDLKASDPAAAPLTLAGHTQAVTEMAFSPDGRWLATASYECDDGVRLWELKGASPSAAPQVIKHEGSVGAVAFSPDGRWLATGGGFSQNCAPDTSARVWDLTGEKLGRQPFVLAGHEGPIFDLAFSPDGNALLTAVGSGFSVVHGMSVSSVNGMRSLFNQQGSTTTHFWYWGAVSAVLSEADAQEEDAQDGEPPEGEARKLDDQQIVLASIPGGAVPHFVLRDPLNAADAFAVSPDRRWAVARSENNLLVWDTLTPAAAFAMGVAKPVILRGHDAPISAVGFSPDGRWLVSGGKDRSARLWDLTAGANSATPINAAAEMSHDSFVTTSADRRLVFAAGSEPQVVGMGEEDPEGWRRIGSVGYVWDLNAAEAGRPLVLRGHSGEIKDAAWSADNRWLVTGSKDKTARLWDLRAADPAARPLVFGGHAGAVDDVALSPDRRWLATASHDGAARLWDLNAPDPTARPIPLPNIERRMDDSYQYTNRVHLSPDGRWLVTAGGFGAPARLWDLQSADPAARPFELGELVFPDECVFSPDGRWLLVHRPHDKENRRRWNEARLWDLKRGPTAAPFVLKSDPDKFVFTQGVAFSADGRWLYTSSREKFVRRWDLAARDPGAEPFIFSGPLEDAEQRLGAIALSADGRWLAAWGDGREAEHRHLLLWDVSAKDTADTPRVLANPGGYVISVFSFSPDSQWLFGGYEPAGDEGGTFRWSVDAADPAPVRLPGGKMLAGEAFSADGRWFITRAASGLQVWPLRTGELLDLACRAAGRNLTQDEWKEYFPGQPYRPTCPGLPEGK